MRVTIVPDHLAVDEVTRVVEPLRIQVPDSTIASCRIVTSVTVFWGLERAVPRKTLPEKLERGGASDVGSNECVEESGTDLHVVILRSVRMAGLEWSGLSSSQNTKHTRKECKLNIIETVDKLLHRS